MALCCHGVDYSYDHDYDYNYDYYCDYVANKNNEQRTTNHEPRRRLRLQLRLLRLRLRLQPLSHTECDVCLCTVLLRLGMPNLTCNEYFNMHSLTARVCSSGVASLPWQSSQSRIVISYCISSRSLGS